jgi:hypothetical protein
VFPFIGMRIFPYKTTTRNITFKPKEAY